MQGAEPVVHVDESRAETAAMGIEPLAVIMNFQDRKIRLKPQIQAHRFGPAMFFDIGDGLLHNSEKVQFHHRQQPPAGGRQPALEL